VPKKGLMHCSKRRLRVAMIYSITSSARASNVGGISMPSALAVFMLRTSSCLKFQNPKFVRWRPDRQTETAYSRWLSLNPRRARPPATMRATQLTDFGTDQSPMMTVHSAKIRTKWKSATTAKIRPAIKENVFWSMAGHCRVELIN
jgi:hypothetical protein